MFSIPTMFFVQIAHLYNLHYLISQEELNKKLSSNIGALEIQ